MFSGKESLLITISIHAKDAWYTSNNCSFVKTNILVTRNIESVFPINQRPILVWKLSRNS